VLVESYAQALQKLIEANQLKTLLIELIIYETS
jgi:hypothetical protein